MRPESVFGSLLKTYSILRDVLLLVVNFILLIEQETILERER